MRPLFFFLALFGALLCCPPARAQKPDEKDAEKKDMFVRPVPLAEERSHPASLFIDANLAETLGARAQGSIYNTISMMPAPFGGVLVVPAANSGFRAFRQRNSPTMRHLETYIDEATLDIRNLEALINSERQVFGRSRFNALSFLDASSGVSLSDAAKSYTAALTYSSYCDRFDVGAQFFNIDVTNGQNIQGYGVAFRFPLDNWSRELTPAYLAYFAAEKRKFERIKDVLKEIRDLHRDLRDTIDSLSLQNLPLDGDREPTIEDIDVLEITLGKKTGNTTRAKLSKAFQKFSSLLGDMKERQKNSRAQQEYVRIYTRIIREVRYSAVLDYRSFNRLETVSRAGLNVSKLWEWRPGHGAPLGLQAYGDLLPVWINRRYRVPSPDYVPPTSLILRGTVGIAVQDQISRFDAAHLDANIRRWHVQGGIEYTPRNGLDEGDTLDVYLKYRDYGRSYLEYGAAIGKGADNHLFVGFSVGASLY